MSIQGYSGLGTLIRAGFLRPVHIVRQFISNNGQTPYPQYAQYIGLDISNKEWFVKPAKSGRDREDTLIPIRVYTNPIGNTSDMEIWGYAHIRFDRYKV